ncbi:MAG TPA: hypothetical protein VHU23_03675 [Rhizomicrobium sp.]|nr:hypothetical protein [Rhizomicrobium sp.]
MQESAYEAADLTRALELFRENLPEYGFKLVMSPPLNSGGPSQAFAAAWRRGTAQAVSFRAATPAQALLRALKSELAKRRETSASASCHRCLGVGRLVTKAGTVEICRHAAQADITAP